MARITTLPSKEDVSKKFKNKNKKVNFSEHRILEKSKIIPVNQMNAQIKLLEIWKPQNIEITQ